MTEQRPLVIIGSARKESDTKFYVDLALKEIDHVQLNLLDYNISSYSYGKSYPVSDEFHKITDNILNYPTIIFATPVYWYSMSGLMKTFFDRFTDLVTIKKEIGRKLKGRSAFLFSVGDDPSLPDGFETPFIGMSRYLNLNYNGKIYFVTRPPRNNEQKLEEIKLFGEQIELSTKCYHEGWK